MTKYNFLINEDGNEYISVEPRLFSDGFGNLTLQLSYKKNNNIITCNAVVIETNGNVRAIVKNINELSH